MLDPQHHTDPPTVRAQPCADPAARRTAFGTPTTRRGTALASPGSPPNCPAWFFPQHHTDPSTRTPHVCRSPAVIDVHAQSVGHVSCPSPCSVSQKPSPHPSVRHAAVSKWQSSVQASPSPPPTPREAQVWPRKSAPSHTSSPTATPSPHISTAASCCRSSPGASSRQPGKSNIHNKSAVVRTELLARVRGPGPNRPQPGPNSGPNPPPKPQ